MYDDILLFINIVEYGNFYKVAKQFDLAQSTITRRIQTLEEQLGMQLLQRNCRTFKLTSAGELFYEQMSSLLPESKQLLEEFHNESTNELMGTLKIALPGISFVKLVSEFAHRHPKVQIISRFLSQRVDLKRDDLDLAISVKLATSIKHKVATLQSLEFKLYASPEYLQKYGEPKNLEDFAQNHKFVPGINGDNSLITQLDAYNKLTGETSIIPVKSNVYAYHSRDLVGFANTHEYIIQTFDTVAEDSLQRGTLVQVLPEFTFGKIHIYLITANRTYSRVENEFIQLLYQLFPATN